MIRICAWCKKELSATDIESKREDAPVTHGICPDCVRKTLSYRAKPLKKFLDQFSDPVFLVTSEARIVVANSVALYLLRKMPEEVHEKLGGEALACIYADLPGGCGYTIHCRTCTIRNPIVETLQTGKSNIRVAAYSDLHFITGERRVRFLITTEKVGEAVLLKIDDVTETKAA